LQAIRLADNRLTSESLPIIINGMGRQYLIELDLSQNSLRGVSCDALSDYFLLPNSLQDLNLSSCTLSNADIERFCSSLSSVAHKLRNLNMSSNAMSGIALNAIHAYLTSSNCRLVRFDVSSCELGSIGAKKLAAAIRINTTLISLNMSSNDIPDEAGEVVIASLSSNYMLERLTLANNNIMARSCFVLAKVLRQCKSLKFIDLSCNPLKEPGGRCLFRELLLGLECEVSMLGAKFDIDDSAFNYSTPEGVYDLDLAQPYQAAILDELLNIAKVY
jgi:Ran GTPase-activating protein (RanGAP) involved in mRNA processing and transport